jgi:hypothetical protein
MEINENQNVYLKQKNFDKLIIGFAGLPLKKNKSVSEFQFKRSLLYKEDLLADILLLKDPTQTWYLNSIPGITSDFEDSLTFIRNLCKSYTKVICVGFSMGGYASILYGSLIENVISIFAFEPQINLNFIIDHSPNLKAFKNSQPNIFTKYENLEHIINQNKKYYVSFKRHTIDVYHHKKHCDLISMKSNVRVISNEIIHQKNFVNFLNNM